LIDRTGQKLGHILAQKILGKKYKKLRHEKASQNALKIGFNKKAR